MVFSLISRLVNGVKGGVTAGLKGVADVSSSVVKVVKDTTVTTLKESTDFVKEGLDIPASIVKGAFTGVGEVGSSIVKAVKGIINGTVQGLLESNVDQKTAVRGSVAQAVHSAKELGIDVGETAVAAVKGSIEARGVQCGKRSWR
jgi:molybdopterin-binding protein